MKLLCEITIPDDFFEKYPTKEWIEEKIKELIIQGGTVTPPPVIPPPTVDPNKCKYGPEIKFIRILSKKTIQVNFMGVDVTEMEYTLSKNNKQVQKAIFKPQNDLPILEFKDDLTSGEYTLKLKATKCTGEDSQTFQYRDLDIDLATNRLLETTFFYSK